MEKSLFWDAQKTEEGGFDRVYSSDDFASMFNGFWGNGVIPNRQNALLCEVLENSNSIIVNAGDAFINGRFYSNTDDMRFTLDISESKDRVDYIALRFDANKRKIYLRVLKGLAGNGAPSYAQNENLFDLILAKVTIPANSKYLSDEDIQDMRGSNLCSWVNIRWTIDNLQTQFQEWYNGIQEKLNNIDVVQLQNDIDITKADLELSNSKLKAAEAKIEQLEKINGRNIIRKNGSIYLNVLDYDAALDTGL